MIGSEQGQVTDKAPSKDTSKEVATPKLGFQGIPGQECIYEHGVGVLVVIRDRDQTVAIRAKANGVLTWHPMDEVQRLLSLV